MLAKVKSPHSWGVITGKVSSSFVIDIEKEDLDEWAILIAENSPLPETLTVRTGGLGLHIYFQYNENLSAIRNGVKLKVGCARIDIRTNGGQVLFPGSVHPNGNIYTPIAGWHVDDPEDSRIVLSKIPKWLRELIIASQK